ncbi:Transcription initiation factor IIA, gamma subunit, helical domain protein [Ancylostoma duodenale]|uniref:Transcription initiation factor IIA subunit 2 n=1 Tax=Ancylostoma duodenale TaxID=51022 RepID=A0A0C2C8Q3_9BILA|nr:Transcription initiation factor IIA, gamma subunit, helical domain protein [Ancylostoma duodenale]
MSYIMYRETTLGVALTHTLDEFVEEGMISRALAAKVLAAFDANINKALAFKVKNKVQFKSQKLLAYRYCDNVWTIIMKGVEFHDVLWPVEYRVEKYVHLMKIVACEALARAMPPLTTATETEK